MISTGHICTSLKSDTLHQLAKHRELRVIGRYGQSAPTVIHSLENLKGQPGRRTP
jgi:hypothetical protein